MMTVRIFVGGALLALLIGKEVIDIAGSLDFIEQRYPRLVKWSERKAWQRGLLLIVTLMYVTILYDVIKEPEPPTYVFGKGAYQQAAELP